MDLISHGLWGGIVLGRRRGFMWAAIFGMMPDLLAFTPYLVQRALQGGFLNIFVRPQVYPEWVHTLYNTSHSLVVAGLLFIALWLWRPNMRVLFLSWPLHILLDIPTHSADCFPTKFLYPLGQLHFNGIHWSNRYIFLVNWSAIFLTYGLYILYRRHKVFDGPVVRRCKKRIEGNPLKPNFLQAPIYPAGQPDTPAKQIHITETSNAKGTGGQ